MSDLTITDIEEKIKTTEQNAEASIDASKRALAALLGEIPLLFSEIRAIFLTENRRDHIRDYKAGQFLEDMRIAVLEKGREHDSDNTDRSG